MIHIVGHNHPEVGKKSGRAFREMKAKLKKNKIFSYHMEIVNTQLISAFESDP